MSTDQLTVNEIKQSLNDDSEFQQYITRNKLFAILGTNDPKIITQKMIELNKKQLQTNKRRKLFKSIWTILIVLFALSIIPLILFIGYSLDIR